MAKLFRTYLQRLPRVKPWVAAAGVLAVGLAAYYALISWEYAGASSERASLTVEERALLRKLRQKPADEATLTAEQGRQQERQQSLGAFFRYPESDDLMAVVSAAARDAGVALERVTVGEANTQTVGDVQYRGQLLSLALRGRDESIFQFIVLLHERAPVAGFSGLTLSGDELTTAAQVQVVFYLSPQFIAPKPTPAAPSKASQPAPGKK